MGNFKIKLLLGALIVTLSSVGLSSAPRDKRESLKESEVQKLLALAVKHSSYHMPQSLPKIYFVNKAELQRAGCKLSRCNLVGFFDRSSSEIFLANDLEINRTLLAQSYVIHELVHYLQYRKGLMNRVILSCKERLQLEQEAYAVQNRFLQKSFSALKLPVVQLRVNFSQVSC